MLHLRRNLLLTQLLPLISLHCTGLYIFLGNPEIMLSNRCSFFTTRGEIVEAWTYNYNTWHVWPLFISSFDASSCFFTFFLRQLKYGGSLIPCVHITLFPNRPQILRHNCDKHGDISHEPQNLTLDSTLNGWEIPNPPYESLHHLQKGYASYKIHLACFSRQTTSSSLSHTEADVFYPSGKQVSENLLRFGVSRLFFSFLFSYSLILLGVLEEWLNSQCESLVVPLPCPPLLHTHTHTHTHH